MEVTIGTKEYTISKMDVFKQFHTLRRMGSLVPSIAGAMSQPDPMLKFGYVSAAIARLSDADASFVMNNCLATCKQKQGTVLAPVVDANGSLMFNDMPLEDILLLTWEVLKFNFEPFMHGLLAKLPEGLVKT